LRIDLAALTLTAGEKAQEEVAATAHRVSGPTYTALRSRLLPLHIRDMTLATCIKTAPTCNPSPSANIKCN
jgi:hypothetical protein